MPYSFDTSGILDAWTRHYPPDVFPSIWHQMDIAAQTGLIFAIDEVVRELERKEDGAHKWVTEHPGMIVSIDAKVQQELTAIMAKYSRLVDTRKNKSGGDPWVIALARVGGLTVVTGEMAAGNLIKPKIPDVCKDMGVHCLGIVDFFREQGWRI